MCTSANSCTSVKNIPGPKMISNIWASSKSAWFNSWPDTTSTMETLGRNYSKLRPPDELFLQSNTLICCFVSVWRAQVACNSVSKLLDCSSICSVWDTMTQRLHIGGWACLFVCTISKISNTQNRISWNSQKVILDWSLHLITFWNYPNSRWMLQPHLARCFHAHELCHIVILSTLRYSHFAEAMVAKL